MAREVIFVVARARDGTIAKDGDVPWKIRADLQRFKRLTMDLPMIMGRKTFDSLPGLQRLSLVSATPTPTGALWLVYRFRPSVPLTR